MSQKVDLKIGWATHKASKYACENWHYSKCIPAGKKTSFSIYEGNKFIGSIIFSRGANSSLGRPYGLSQIECCELTRIALTSHQSPVTRMVKICLKMLLKISPGLKLIVSFADTKQGHHGGIYQGGNWIYSGRSNAAEEYLVNGKQMHGRSMRAKYGSHVGKAFIKPVMGSQKHRYLLPLTEEIRMQIMSLKKPYPKRAVSKDNVASGFQSEEGGATPTTALQQKGESNAT